MTDIRRAHAAALDTPKLHPGFRFSSISSLRNNLRGAENHTGKCLYHIDAYLAIVPDALPTHSILSHDVVEGCLLNPVYADGAAICESPPAGGNRGAAIQQRWMRGDFQNLLIYGSNMELFGKIGADAYLKLSRVALSHTRELLILLFVAACLVTQVDPMHANVAVLSFLLFEIASYHPLRNASTGMAKHFARRIRCYAFDLLSLPHRVYLSIEALLVSAFRVLIARRHLMYWTSSADDVHASPVARHTRPVVLMLTLGLLLSVSTFDAYVPLALIVFWAFGALIRFDRNADDTEVNALEGRT